jgi:aspartyl-tRNA(Asn)/glutamyl-tRNA(Gln) amidotransferase subunit A
VERVIRMAIKKMESAGARVEEITLPHSEYALPAYYIIVSSEVSANLARFDGIRYSASGVTSYQLAVTSLYDSYAETRVAGFGPEVKRRIMLGTYALSAGYHDAFYLKAQKVRRLIREDFQNAFKKVDIIVGPTVPTPAFGFGERDKEPLQMYLADIYTVAVNLAGLPALSLPAGAVMRQGVSLPVGLQLITPWFAEEMLFAAAEHIESLLS